MSPDALERPLPPSVFARLAAATRYAITGVAPDTWFGPQQPLPPMAPPEVKGRQFDYPFGANLNYMPRAEGGLSFAELRALADALPLLRAVIETRKDQVASLSHAVRQRSHCRARSLSAPGGVGDPALQRADASTRIDAASRFLARPDRRHAFADWLRMLLEDMLVIDAAAIYPRFTRAGALFSLDIVDGATIKPLIGEDGRSPEPPDPAYQQVLHGVPAADFSADELLYLPRNVRAHRLYGMSPVEARDQGQIEIFGPRVGPTIQGHEICDEFVVGPIVAQTILQRELYVRTKFAFKLSWEHCLIDPMDVVTITDANLGLSNYPVRVVTIEEDDEGLLAITAEELVTGVSTPAFYQNASPGGFQPNWGVPAVPVNTPLIFEPPISAMTNGVAQIWVGASGIDGGGANQWGGANVYVSVDDMTYSQIAVLAAPLRQGFLTAYLPAAAGWDSADTLAVTLAASGGALSGTSQAAAQAGATLSLIDSEIIAYETATLTGANAYILTGLARALGGTNGASHATGAPFARLDGAIVKYNLPSNLAGQTLYFKFQSFNVFGGGLEDLSTCAVYTYTPKGASTTYPIAGQLKTGFALELGQVIAAPTLADDFGEVTAAVTDLTDLGAVATTASHPIMTAIMTGANQDLDAITSAVTLSDDFGSVADAVVDPYALGTVP